MTVPRDISAQDANEIVNELEEGERKIGALKPLRRDGTGGLTIVQVARRLGMSVPWVRLHIPELKGRKTKQGYRFPENITVEKVREVLDFKTYKSNRVAMTRNEAASETARVIFTELRKGTPTIQIVERFGFHPKVVREYAAEWVRCGQFDDNEFAIIHGHKKPEASHAPIMPPVAPAPLPPVEEAKESAVRTTVKERLAAMRRQLETEEDT